MAFMMNQPEVKEALKVCWAPLRLRGLPDLQLSHHFEHTDELEALVLSVRIDPGGWVFKYGMTRCDLGSAWNDDKKARRRLKGLAEAELRKDLFLFHDKKKVPCSVLRITWLDSKGRTIGSSIFPPSEGDLPKNSGIGSPRCCST
jgi:hypothetical protein